MALPLLAMAAALVAPGFAGADADALNRAFAEGRVYAPVAAVVTLDVAPDGTIIACQMGQAEGDKSSLRRICPVLEKQRLSRTASADGQAQFGRVVAVVSIKETGDDAHPLMQVGENPEMQLKVNQLPKDAGSTLKVNLTLQVSAEGNAVACESEDHVPQPFVNAACRSLASQPGVANADGNPVPYVTSAAVRFVTQGG
ncbi:hypothetical protein [Novosphingobium naphthalenivorans]|uniref:hypothetical protein n=1 Tax=Novosphingobium naphthalenivorans TaxID=273168 RepID=UPI0008373916|nr:hypothetical protein [Novosphingobium naphthalenivorans]